MFSWESKDEIDYDRAEERFTEIEEEIFDSEVDFTDFFDDIEGRAWKIAGGHHRRPTWPVGNCSYYRKNRIALKSEDTLRRQILKYRAINDYDRWEREVRKKVREKDGIEGIAGPDMEWFGHCVREVVEVDVTDNSFSYEGPSGVETHDPGPTVDLTPDDRLSEDEVEDFLNVDVLVRAEDPEEVSRSTRFEKYEELEIDVELDFSDVEFSEYTVSHEGVELTFLRMKGRIRPDI